MPSEAGLVSRAPPTPTSTTHTCNTDSSCTLSGAAHATHQRVLRDLLGTTRHIDIMFCDGISEKHRERMPGE